MSDDNKCKTGIVDICDGETERVNEHGVRQCAPCAAHIADCKTSEWTMRTHFQGSGYLWRPEPNRVPWRFSGRTKSSSLIRHKPDVMKGIDWDEVMDRISDERIDDDLKHVHECDDDCIINYRDLRESLDLILTAHHPDIRDEVMGMWGDAVGNNADAHLRFSCPFPPTCCKEMGEDFWLMEFHSPYRTHEQVMADCDCPKCVVTEEE